MQMISVTDIRKNIRGILSEVVKTKKPAVILQRSRPVAYLIDAESFDKIQKSGESEFELLTKSRIESLERISQLRAKIAKKGVRGDSTQIIRELREGQGRYE
ncbi:MAG: type II toxin-antitoxin system Phd/YefM family antitoxin [Bacillota bacterium]